MKLTSIIIVLLLNLHLFGQSPYKLSWGNDGWIAGGGLVTCIAGVSLDDAVKPLTIQEIDKLSRDNINSFDRSASFNFSEKSRGISDALLGVALVSPALLFADKNMRSDFSTISTMYIETIWYAVFLTSIAKGSAQRIRLYAYNKEVSMSDKLTSETRRSFYSGHTSTAFASLVFLSTVFSEYYPNSKYTPYVIAGSVLTAGAVGLMRVQAGVHFPTDVIAGALTGAAIGYLIPYFHKQQSSNLSISPQLRQHSSSVAISIVF